jgi:phage anti-repressor protein
LLTHYGEIVHGQKRARTYEQENHIMTLDMAKEISMIQRIFSSKPYSIIRSIHLSYRVPISKPLCSSRPLTAKLMNEIQQLFNLKRNEDGTVAVSGRELHKGLEIGTRYDKWLIFHLIFNF